MLDLPLAMLRQCAWCLVVADATGHYTIHPARKIKSATHGICPACKDRVRAEIDASPLLVAA
jgi:hypothetical protein